MRTLYLKSVVFLSMLLLAACQQATAEPPLPIYQKVLPGDKSLRPEIMRAHRIRYEKTGGFMEYELNKITKNGLAALQMKVFYNKPYDPEGYADIMIFDAKTLGYRGRRLGGGPDSQYLIEMNFKDGKLTGDLTPLNGSDYTPRHYDKSYPHNAFEPAIINYFIAALPLKQGYTASIPVFDLNDGTQMFWSNIEVEKKEILKIDGVEFETWKVVSDGIRNKTIWVSTTEPYAIKMVTKGNFGAWKIVPDKIH